MKRSGHPIGRSRQGALALLVALFIVGLALSPAPGADTPPLRVIADKDPNFNTLWVDTVNDEILVGNDAQETLQVYSRTANGLVAPLREIKGRHTFLTFPGQVFVDPKNNEIWSVGNDIADLVTVHSRMANGDVAPIRELSLKPLRLNRTWGFFVDTVNDELMLTHQRRNQVTVWSRTAVTGAKPLRTIGGSLTGLANPHGVFVDTTTNEIYVVNQGHTTGAMALPSITVYARNASGNATPLRTIQGAATRLDDVRPIFVDSQRREIVVASGSSSNAILYFGQLANGNVEPLRVLAGDRAGLSNPSGVFVDTVNNELLVANWGNHTITVYPRGASGNAPPLRVISPTTSRVAVGISNPGAIGVDPLRDEIWATNCVSHPRLAVFARQVTGQVAPLRVIEGQRTGLTRGGHGIAIDLVNNEVAASVHLAGAIAVFDRGARGNVAPIRTIIGPNTRLHTPEGVAVDNTHNELVVSNNARNSLLVFERTANGDVAPLREIRGPRTEIVQPQGIAVDPVHDEIFVAVGETGPAAILVFPRTANGDVAPIRKIAGPNTGMRRPRQLQFDVQRDEIVLADRGRVQEFVFDQPGFIGVWQRTDNGDVPPRRLIRGPNSQLASPRSVYVDTVNNEIGAGDTNTHAILIFPRDF